MFEFFKQILPKNQRELNDIFIKDIGELKYEFAFLKEMYHFSATSVFEIRLANTDAIYPLKSHENDAGFDLHSPRDFTYYQFRQNLSKGRHTYIDTGVCINIKPGFVGLVCPRSSMSLRSLPCDLGVIDAGYQGSIKVLLPPPCDIYQHPEDDVLIKKGDRIAQIIFLKLPQIKLNGVLKFSQKTERGEGGLGSSGR